MFAALLAYCRSVAARFLHRQQSEDDLEQELGTHMQHRADDLERTGLSRAEAERRARLEFGGRERFKEEVREAFGGNGIETLIQDVRYSLRVLRKVDVTMSLLGLIATWIPAQRALSVDPVSLLRED